jgi:hypothetical protein
MKKMIFITLLLLFVPFINAEEVKEREKTYDELMAEFFKVSEEVEKIDAKLLAEKKETKSAIKVNEKLDEIKELLSR